MSLLNIQCLISSSLMNLSEMDIDGITADLDEIDRIKKTGLSRAKFLKKSIFNSASSLKNTDVLGPELEIEMLDCVLLEYKKLKYQLTQILDFQEALLDNPEYQEYLENYATCHSPHHSYKGA